MSLIKNIVFLVFCLAFLYGCSKTPQPQIKAEKPKEYTLSYKAIRAIPLRESRPDSDWKKRRTIDLAKVAGQEPVSVVLYEGPVNQEKGFKEIKAFLVHDGRMFESQGHSFSDHHSILVTAADLNGDGKEELEITGEAGSAQKTQIIGFDSVDNRWVLYLASDGIKMIDLDLDGDKELVAFSTTSAPNYLWLCRWRGDSFEKADAAEVTGNLYANLYTENQQIWIIEAGQANEPRFYFLKKDRLIEVTNPSKTS